MITLEQVLLLDEKIQKAVDTITTLRQENTSLKTRLGEYQTRIEELEVLIKDFKNDQGEIEEGILKALKQLDMVDSSTSEATPDDTPAETEADSMESEADTESTAESSPEPETTSASAPVTESAEPAVESETDDESETAPSSYEQEMDTETSPEEENPEDGAVELDIF